MRILIAIMLLLSCATARADNDYGYIFSVTPNPVSVGMSIGVTMETIGVPCVPLTEQLYYEVQEGGIVYLAVPGSDGCDAVVQETRHYTIDSLPPGQYFFRFYTCGGLDAETNEAACFTIAEIPVTVLGLDAQRRTIPAASTAALLVLALITILLAGLHRSR